MIWNCFGSLDSDERLFSKWQTNWKRNSNIWIGRARYLQFSQAGEQRWILANEHPGRLQFPPFFFFFGGGGVSCCCFFLFFFLFLFFLSFNSLLLLFLCFLFLCLLSEEVFLTAVCAFERQTVREKQSLPICFQRVPLFFFFFFFFFFLFLFFFFWPCGQKRLNYLTRMHGKGFCYPAGKRYPGGSYRGGKNLVWFACMSHGRAGR